MPIFTNEIKINGFPSISILRREMSVELDGSLPFNLELGYAYIY